MTFISYAQNYEDVTLWRALRDVKRGFYVDVGAADPEVDSVTNAFYERGWSGINIEPMDEYFRKLTKARPRDTNLNVAVGGGAGLRTMHAFPGTGLSTLDAEIGARHHASGFSGSEFLVPVLTLTNILEDCGAPTIHFLKIDVEGAEAEVLEGLNLERIRPWVIIIEASEPNSTAITRRKWEHLVTGRGYGFAYFDGLNCFYVADEVASLKERLAVPPSFFDDFMRFSEWTSRQEAAKLGQELAGLRGHADVLEAALEGEQAQTVNLRNSLQAEQAQTVNLRNSLQAEQAQTADLRSALQAEQAQTADLRSALQAEQAQTANLSARLDHQLGRIRLLEAQFTVPSVDRAVGRALRRVQKTGDQLTGGGLRSLARRALTSLAQRSMRDRRLMVLGRAVLKPFPKIATTLYQFATKQDAVPTSAVPTSAVPTSAVPTSAGPLPSDDASTVGTLPASARATYLRLKAAMSDGDAWNRTQ